MKTLLFILLFIAGQFSQARSVASAKNAKILIPGVGQVRIQHEVVGEPISQPERVEVFVTCQKSKKKFRAAIFRMCIYEGHTFEEGTKTLTLTMKYGRVVPTTGDVVCDQHDMKILELAAICQGQ